MDEEGEIAGSDKLQAAKAKPKASRVEFSADRATPRHVPARSGLARTGLALFLSLSLSLSLSLFLSKGKHYVDELWIEP